VVLQIEDLHGRGAVRPSVGGALLALAAWMLYRRWRRGWALPESTGPALREG